MQKKVERLGLGFRTVLQTVEVRHDLLCVGVPQHTFCGRGIGIAAPTSLDSLERLVSDGAQVCSEYDKVYVAEVLIEPGPIFSVDPPNALGKLEADQPLLRENHGTGVRPAAAPFHDW